MTDYWYSDAALAAFAGIRTTAAATPPPMTGDTYPGGTMWGVRWGEAGMPVRCREYGDEEQARVMWRHLTRRYVELGRSDRPQLIRARIEWEVVPEATTNELAPGEQAEQVTQRDDPDWDQ